jgi:hypothetical protein
MSLSWKRWLPAALLLGLVLPFSGKPVHIDDANFLTLAQGARLDPWRPHDIPVNWQGSTEAAFDVLSNPPGIGWWLAPVLDGPLWVQHLWMLPWLLLLTWGARRLGRRFGGDGDAALLLIGSAPLVVLAAQSLTPDLPLIALTAAGLGGYLGAVDEGRGRAAAGWALVAGSAVLFRYSGLCLIPLLLLYPALRRKIPWAGLAGLAPLLLLLAHDLHAYGRLHLVAMGGFQSISNTGWLSYRKLVAALAMFGAAGVLPVLAFRVGWRALIPAFVGAFLGLGAAIGSELSAPTALWTAACTGAGAAVLLGPLATIRAEEGRSDLLFLLAWALGGLAFLLLLRFTAGRYWLPFLPAVALAWLRLRPGRRLLALAVGAQVVLALLLSVDDYAMARAGRDAALAVDREATARATQCEDGAGERVFAGHWGWQHQLEQLGWRGLEDEELLRVGALLAVAEAPWPQEPAAGSCLELLWERSVPDRWPGPRVHSLAGRANLHAFVIAGQPPVETYVPWTLADDPRDHIALYRACD